MPFASGFLRKRNSDKSNLQGQRLCLQHCYLARFGTSFAWARTCDRQTSSSVGRTCIISVAHPFCHLFRDTAPLNASICRMRVRSPVQIFGPLLDRRMSACRPSGRDQGRCTSCSCLGFSMRKRIHPCRLACVHEHVRPSMHARICKELRKRSIPFHSSIIRRNEAKPGGCAGIRWDGKWANKSGHDALSSPPFALHPSDDLV